MIVLVMFLFLAIVNSYIKLIVTSENPRVRKLFKKQAIRFLKKKIERVESMPPPIFMEIYFNRKHYENFYVDKGFNQTIEYLFETTLKQVEEVEKVKEYPDVSIYKIEIKDE